MKLYSALFLLLLPALSPRARAADPVIAAAGDIACDPLDTFYNGGLGTDTACRMRATSDLALAGGYDAVLLLGDNQYLDGALSKYVTVFGPTWGRLGSLLRPAPGNHEYETPGATGYFDYFGAAAGKRTEGWYSYELGTWHVVVLNSNCADVGGCGPGSPQLRWLAADLAAHPRACTLAYWHHPRFSSGLHNNDPLSDAFWRTLYAAGADLVLVGHDHDYERFAPQDPDGQADPAHGIREFVAGTGGREVRPFTTLRANSEVRNAQDLGILKLRLRSDGYDWQFLPVPGGTFTDAGSAGCHNAPDAASLFLHQGRFQAQATWRDAAGHTGTARLAAPATDGSGLFWFFSADNWELMVKVIDGCALNDRYWVYAAGTTDVEYTLTVTDTLTGRTARYENPLGRASPAVTDTEAFPTCP
ncbi:MAG TPA: metallophosphoesterase [Thermoanaerobaculia bacterium]|nr:metallophosphoesterase [Thermoanaerobaculia bacterium]